MTLARTKKLLLALPLFVLVAITAPVYWLLHTSSGASWLWNRAVGLDAAGLSASEVTGDLAGGLVIRDLTYRSDGFDLSVRQVGVQAGAGWWPPSIEVRKLSLLDTDVLIHAGGAAADQADEYTDAGSLLGWLEPPVPVTIADALLTGIDVRRADDTSVIEVESVSFGMSLGRQLLIDHLDILAAGLESHIKASLVLASPYELSLDAETRLEYATGYGAKPLDLPFRLEGAGDLERLKLTLTSTGTGLHVEGEIADPLDSAQWDLDANLDRMRLPEEIGGQDITLSGISLAGQGDRNAWSFELDSALTEDHAGDGRIAVAGTGTPDGIEITGATLTGAGLDLDVSGSLDWSAQMQASLKTVIRRLDLSPWLADWPEGDQLAGELELNWSGQDLSIPKGHLGIDGTPATVDFEADIDIAAEAVSARVNWNNLAWPPEGAAAVFSSRSGHLYVSGGLADWRAKGQLDIRLGDYPRGSFDIEGGGDRTSAHILVPEGEILGGVIRGEAGADWSEGLTWNAAINAHGIDPSPVLGDWPGKLDGDIQIEAGGQPQSTRINIKSLQGLLRGVPVSARGGIEVTESGPGFRSLDVQTDEAVLKLDGVMTDPGGVKFSFDGEIPAMLVQGARGSARIEGRYSDLADNPRLDLQMHGLDLAWNELSVGTLDVSTSSNTDSEPVLQVAASDAVWKDVQLDSLSLDIDPADDQYRVNLKLTDDDIVLGGVMLMRPESAEVSLDSRWHGLLSEFEVDIGPAYSFGLSQPVALHWSSSAITMEPLCLSERAGPSLCIDLDYRNNGDWSLLADANAIPLDYLRDYLDLDVHLEQTLEGHLEWRHLHGQAPTGGADFRITAGRILDLLDDDVLTTTNDGRFAFSLQNGNLESGILKIEFPGTGFLDADFKVLNIAGDGQQTVEGRIITHMDKLTLAGQLALPGVDAVDGRFDSDIQIGGSLENPELDGGFKLSNGLIDYAPVGLKLENIELQGRVHKRDVGEFRGSFRAGEGNANFNGRFLFDDAGSPQLNVGLEGGPLLLVNTDALKIFSEADLKVAFAPDRIELNGQITIPTASLTPANLQLEEVRDSEDLVIESREPEVENAAQQSASEHRFFGQLEVTLGNEVHVRVPGIEAKINGSTMFKWSGESVPMAQGSYNIRGKVDIYGPTLRINNGTVSFPDVPANNPLLNIRAGRDIYGNTQIRSAGVQVIGNLKHPVLEAYTVPVTNEDRAWTLLVTGTDFDQAQGVSGFDLGTYIAPKLYVSYGVSLFEDENVISARYDLKKGFGVKVTSGQRETGLDVSYTINR